jgi:hypothetical protein
MQDGRLVQTYESKDEIMDLVQGAVRQHA